MAKQQQRVELNNFIKGLITEASPLNFPQNASLSEENFELNRNGSRDRRLGLAYETSYALQDSPLAFSGYDAAKTVTFKWVAVNGDSDDNFLVAQINKYLLFFDLGVSDISNSGYLGQLLLSSFPDNTQFSFASSEGRLVAASGSDTVAIISYVSSVFSVEYDNIKVRDLWGVEETTIPSYESDSSYRGSYSAQHGYNLQNQSWGVPRKNEAGTLGDPATIYNTSLSVYPSNSEAVWPGLQFQAVSAGSTPYERVFPTLYQEVLGAETSSAKGYYVIDLLKRGTSRVAAFAANKTKYPSLTFSTVTLPTDTTSGGASLVAEFAGRIWYAGFNGQVSDGDRRSPNLNNFAVFSQLIKSRQDFVKCYQAGDPTSREGSEIIDTDGGFVRVTGANKIVAILNMESHLIFLADNGVWALTGGNDYGFSATNYKLTKVSTFGCISSTSVVMEGKRAFFWSEDGIYMLGKDQVGDLTVENITEKTIQTFYEDIPNTSKGNARGVYDPSSKKIRWLYKDGSTFGADSVTKELVLDTSLAAFYVNRIGNLATNSAEVVGIFSGEPFAKGVVGTPVVSLTTPVVIGASDVVMTETLRQSGLQSVRYLIAINTGGVSKFTIGYFSNSDFRDWQNVDGVGVDAFAFMLTGDMTGGDSAVTKQVPYLTMHFLRTEEGVTEDLVPDKQSGCLVRMQWNWSDSIESGKWTALQQAYRYRQALYVSGLTDTYDNGMKLVSSKTKVRGMGDAFALYLETEPYKDCRILGWNISITGNTIE